MRGGNVALRLREKLHLFGNDLEGERGVDGLYSLKSFPGYFRQFSPCLPLGILGFYDLGLELYAGGLGASERSLAITEIEEAPGLGQHAAGFAICEGDFFRYSGHRD